MDTYMRIILKQNDSKVKAWSKCVLYAVLFTSHPPEITIFTEMFLNIYQNLKIFQYFQKSGQNPRRNQNLGVSGLDSQESVPPVKIRPPCRNFVAMPLVTDDMLLGYGV